MPIWTQSIWASHAVPTTESQRHTVAYPAPSSSFHTHASVDAVFTWLTLAAVLVAVGYVARVAVRRRTSIPVLILLGGLAAALVEPLASTIGMVQYPAKSDQWTGIEAFNDPVPVFVVLAYGLEVGVGALIAWTLLLRGLGGRALARAWLIIMIFDLVLESAGIWLKVFRYYGHQPFDFWGMPLWWLPIDASICLIPGLAAYALSTWGGRWYAKIALVALFPISAAIMYSGAGWPVFLLLHTDLPAAVVWLGGVPAVVISVLLVVGVVRVGDRLGALRRAFLDAPTTTAVPARDRVPAPSLSGSTRS